MRSRSRIDGALSSLKFRSLAGFSTHCGSLSPENESFGVVAAALSRLNLKRRLALPHMYAAPSLIASSDIVATLMAHAVTASGQADRLCVLPPPIDVCYRR